MLFGASGFQSGVKVANRAWPQHGGGTDAHKARYFDISAELTRQIAQENCSFQKLQLICLR
jgi:hypothetical protein